MKLKASKTKRMRGNFSFDPPSYPPIVTDNETVSIVKHAKLLAILCLSKFKCVERIAFARVLYRVQQQYMTKKF